jgi:hypothetical protein
MKNVFLFFILFFISFAGTVNAQNDAISKYFDKYVDDERFTVVYISPKIFEIFDKLDLDLEMDANEAEAIRSVVKDMKGLRILVAEENIEGLFDEASKTINMKEYETLMTVRNKDEDNVHFLIKDEGDVINELLLLVGGKENFVLMSFMGNIDLNNISKLAKAFEDNDDDHNDDKNYDEN